MFNLAAIPLAYRIGAIVLAGLALYGYARNAGVQAERTRWEARQAQAAEQSLIDYMAKQQRIDTAVVQAGKDADQRIAQANTTASTLQAQLNAIRSRKPIPAANPGCPAHVLDDERVQWANRALGYTTAPAGL